MNQTDDPSRPSRRQRIEQMLAEDPNDVFLRYSLALELAKEGDREGCLQRLEALQQDTPPYVPAFFMAAQQLSQAQRFGEARAALRAGIEQAESQGDAHAAGEMREFLMSLNAEGE